MTYSNNPHPCGKVPIDQIVKWLKALITPMFIVEMRVIRSKNRSSSKFYKSNQLRQMAGDAVEFSKTAKGVYFTLNPLPAGHSTPARDVDVTQRRWLLIDFDPIREGTVSTTDSEKQLAREKMLHIKEYLTDKGWPEPVVADSGNGWHLLYRIDFPNDDESKTLINRFLQELANRFSDDSVDIDTKVGNASRICKLYGTVARKGDETKGRPHRVSRITQIPEELIPVSRNLLEQETDEPVSKTNKRPITVSPFSVERMRFRLRFAIPIRYLRKCDPAISGCGGHTTTLNTVLKLLGNFPDLTTDDEAFEVLSHEWNQRCEPPWNEADLRRKITEARKIGPHAPEPFEKGSEPSPKGKPNNHKRNDGVSRTVSTPPIPAVAFQPFPAHALPELLFRYVTSVAQAIGCDVAFVAVPMLAVLAAVIGNSRRIELKKGWTEPAIVWSVIIGESGTQKTPAFKYVVSPIRELQERKLRDHQNELDEYKNDFAKYQLELDEWKKKGANSGEPPDEPVKPKAVRYIVSDATMEALATILADNHRGVLYLRDELAGWIGSHDKYSKGNTDQPHWLSIFSGESLLVDRKTGDRQTISIPRPAVSVTGGIQPATLQRVFGVEQRESGLLARILVARSPRRAKIWSDEEVPAELNEAYANIIHGLLELEPAFDDEKQPQPVVMPLTQQARETWKSFVNQHGFEQAKLIGDEAAAWSKLEAYAARFALIIHCVRIVLDDSTIHLKTSVDRQSIRSGIILARWFGQEALRVYAMLRESEKDRELRQIAEELALRGKKLTARELSETDRKFRTSDDAERKLQQLVEYGYGEWENVPTTPKGGRPTRAYRPNSLSVRET